jgi:hypothetical protein
MPDEARQYDDKTMSKKNGVKTKEEESNEESEEEETDDTETEDEESAEEETEEESEEESEDEPEEESEDEDESEEGSSTEDDDDIDDEIEKERKAGEADPEIAKNAFKERKNKRGTGESGDDDKPLTKKDLLDLEDRIRKDTLRNEANAIAKELAGGSAKQAQLIMLKWQNRTFPKTLTLREQMTEAFVIANAKKLMGERNEALRALKGKRGVKDGAAGTHHDAPRGPGEPKLPPSDAAALRQSGFSWNVRTKRYEKKLQNGTLIRDNQTKQIRLERRKK